MQVVNPPWQLKPRRVHEVCGPAAMPFALAMAAQARGPMMFVDSVHRPDRLHPLGAGMFIDMARLLVACGSSHTDILWIAEEALRSGYVPVVIARLGENIGLTAGRRLQLAAEAGKALGVFLLPEGMGSNAAETRWHCNRVSSSADQFESTLFEWNCIKNKTGTIGSWMVRWNDATHHIDILPQTGDRSLSAAEVG